MLYEQSMNTRHADIVQAIYGVPEKFCRHRCFFSNRHIRRAGRHYEYDTASRRGFIVPKCYHAGGLVEHGVRQKLPDGVIRITVCARNEQTASARDDVRCDGGDLFGCLSGTVDDLWHALSERSMMVDTRKTEILERFLSKQLKNLLESRADSNLAALDLSKQSFQFNGIHEGLTDVDSVLCCRVKCSVGPFLVTVVS